MNTKAKPEIVQKVKHAVERRDTSKKPVSPVKSKSQPQLTARQQREQIRAQLALLILIGFVFIIVALVITALSLATNSNDLLEITGRLLPYLITLLTPILHYYFGHKSSHDDKER